MRARPQRRGALGLPLPASHRGSRCHRRAPGGGEGSSIRRGRGPDDVAARAGHGRRAHSRAPPRGGAAQRVRLALHLLDLGRRGTGVAGHRLLHPARDSTTAPWAHGSTSAVWRTASGSQLRGPCARRRHAASSDVRVHRGSLLRLHHPAPCPARALWLVLRRQRGRADPQLADQPPAALPVHPQPAAPVGGARRTPDGLGCLGDRLHRLGTAVGHGRRPLPLHVHPGVQHPQLHRAGPREPRQARGGRLRHPGVPPVRDCRARLMGSQRDPQWNRRAHGERHLGRSRAGMGRAEVRVLAGEDPRGGPTVLRRPTPRKGRVKDFGDPRPSRSGLPRQLHHGGSPAQAGEEPLRHLVLGRGHQDHPGNAERLEPLDHLLGQPRARPRAARRGIHPEIMQNAAGVSQRIPVTLLDTAIGIPHHLAVSLRHHHHRFLLLQLLAQPPAVPGLDVLGQHEALGVETMVLPGELGAHASQGAHVFRNREAEGDGHGVSLGA
ncbi:adenosine deaminase [Stigmatella aurantiaca DW4/3-1]|uniref:Adenosine deaminase n=1 Tax=Stigmatella aurantiaca (strain DW4/3-1) TaxID=378806 RepID=Q08SD0_STIAD|nr:adenosine deaminase [Stigmatella aurantiaca DW4/3-1]